MKYLIFSLVSGFSPRSLKSVSDFRTYNEKRTKIRKISEIKINGNIVEELAAKI